MKRFFATFKNLITRICYSVFLLIFSFACVSFADEVKIDKTQIDKVQPAAVAAQTLPENTPTSSPSPGSSAPVATTSPVNAQKAAPATTNSASQVANLIGGLAIIVVLIYGLSWFVKRFAQGGFMQNPNMKVISSMPLGTRERLMLVEVGGKQILLGVTAAQVNTLHVFDEPITVTEKTQLATSDFSQKLMAILQQKNTAPDVNTHKKSNS
ncbi:MAG: flagellar biosynthetic protein FliO [Cellvibrio sp.]